MEHTSFSFVSTILFLRSVSGPLHFPQHVRLCWHVVIFQRRLAILLCVCRSFCAINKTEHVICKAVPVLPRSLRFQSSRSRNAERMMNIPSAGDKRSPNTRLMSFVFHNAFFSITVQWLLKYRCLKLGIGRFVPNLRKCAKCYRDILFSYYLFGQSQCFTMRYKVFSWKVFLKKATCRSSCTRKHLERVFMWEWLTRLQKASVRKQEFADF